jgi:GNAT superfamily N-acetyltransferase
MGAPMKLEIRPLRDEEAPLVWDSWTRSIDARVVKDQRKRERVASGKFWTVNRHRGAWIRLGSDMLADWAFFEMHRSWVKTIFPSLDVIVATLPGQDEVVGWCAMTPAGERPLVVHYVYVVGPPLQDVATARGQGVARQLLASAARLADHRAPRFSHMRGTPVQFTADLDSKLAAIVDDAWRQRNSVPVAASRDGAVVH